jgi:hypothetical protein
MKKVWNSWLRESVFVYCVIYTVGTIANSIMYLLDGIREDPSGNWHELTRALILLIGIVAFELAKNLPIKNVFLRAIVVYIPTMGLAFFTVWVSQFIEPLAKSAYHDIFINYTGLFLIVAIIAIVGSKIKKRKVCTGNSNC